MFIYPENLKAKPKLWLWQLRDISIIGICMILSALALARYSARQTGAAPTNAIEQQLDEHFPDSRMQRIYPKAKFV